MVRIALFVLLVWSPVSLAASEVEALLWAGRVAEALPAARVEAEAAPSDLAVHERYIDILLSLGMPSLADATYRERLARTPDADSHYLLGRAVLTAEEARVLYHEALKLNPDHARSMMGMGAVHRASGQYDDAIIAYRDALGIDPRLSEAWAGLGAALLSLGRVEEALQAAREGMANVPGEADSYLAVSVLAPSEAEDVLRKAVKHIPDDPRVHAALAEVLLEAGNGRGARKEATAALDIDPGRGDARLSLMFAESMAQGWLDAEGYRGMVEARGLEEVAPLPARERYDALVASYPRSPLPWMGRARSRASQGDVAGAMEDLGAALERDPANIEAMAAMGLVLLELGRASEARPPLKRSATERPHDASLAVAAAMAAEASGDRVTALQELENAGTHFPWDARVALTRAKILADAGRSEDAYLVLRDAVERLPGDDRLVLSLAAAAKDLGRNEEAAILMDELARRTRNAAFSDLARKLRATAPPTPE
ncbi:MAG: tetratricopeptide repeat protein [Deltaproteobacteria bacterium]|nr:tetratricopeptide repeat protein [Deltaproteobacteria bacterium]